MASSGDTLRIVLLGKTGAGKSSLGNALLNRTDETTQFEVTSGLNSGTERCAWQKETHPNGLTVEVVDTPGLCDTHKPAAEIYKEVGKSVALTGKGPHVLIFALKCERFTNEERQAFMAIKAMFSEEMNNHLIWVFTRLDSLTENLPPDSMDTIRKQRQILDEQVVAFGRKGGPSADLKNMIDAAKGGYFGINNKASQAVKDIQVQDLLKKMLALREQNGRKCYTTPVVTDINKIVESMVTKRAEQKHIPRTQAEDEIKKDIVEENVEPGFFATIGRFISSAGSAILGACSVM